MSFTVDQIIDGARYQLQDVDKDRHSDVRFLSAINAGLSELRGMRPDLIAFRSFVDDNFPLKEQIIKSGTALPLSAHFYTPLLDFVVGYVSMADDEAANDQRAVALLSRFKATLRQG